MCACSDDESALAIVLEHCSEVALELRHPPSRAWLRACERCFAETLFAFFDSLPDEPTPPLNFPYRGSRRIDIKGRVLVIVDDDTPVKETVFVYWDRRRAAKGVIPRGIAQHIICHHEEVSAAGPDVALCSVWLLEAKELRVGAFARCANLVHVSMPAVKYIGKRAFKGCTALRSVACPAQIVQDQAFASCTALRTVSLPQSWTISEHVFYDCINLTAVSMRLAQRIELAAFGNCTALTAVSFPKVRQVDKYAFRGCSMLETVLLPHASDIDPSAMSGCTNLRFAARDHDPYWVPDDPYY